MASAEPAREKTQRTRSGLVQSVDRALQILNFLSTRSDGFALTTISQELGLNISTCHHLISTLAYRNYVEQDPQTKRYMLGPKVLHLKNIALAASDLYAQALPVLRELNEKSQETVHLAVLRNDELLTVAKLDALHSVRINRPDDARAIHCTATGKAILAYLPEPEAQRLLDLYAMVKFTPRTIVDRDLLEEELQRVREQGYALDIEEFNPGVCCIGAPVRNHDGQVVGSFSVSVPVFRADYARMQELVAMVLEAAQKISYKLGYAE